jgi:polyhydroxybutyrate depolymerase
MHREKATVVASFDDKIVSYFHSIAPDVEVSPGLNVLTAYVLNGTPIPDGMRILQLPPEYSGLKVITPKLVADATRRGYPIWIWPNNRDLENYAHYLSYLRQGIAGLNINFPEQGVAALHRYQGDAQLAVVSPSAGCGTAAEPLAADSTTSFTLPTNPTVKGTFIEHVPPAYDGTHALPLVIDLHGWSQPAALKFTEDAMPAAADRYRFITIAPDITRPVPLWDTSLTGTDAAWVAALVDHLETTQCIDRFRVYATGMSNGAMMTSTLACTMSTTLAAVAPVAGVHDPKGCSTTRHVPLMAFHGTDDPYLSYKGGYGPKVAGLASPDGKGTLGSSLPTADEDAIPVPDRVQGWATRNGCDPGPTTADIAAGVTGTSWVCPANGTTELITITGGGHTWPGSAFDAKLPDMMGSTTTAIDATEMIWDFFATHPIISE